ncbi:MAG: spore germination protein GerW family protein [Anaerolineae bacterium]
MSEKVTQATQPIEQMLERLSVDAVFGEPTTEGGVTIIPVAEVGAGFGYGFGWGQAPGETAETGEGGGGGGGAGGRARPVGCIQISPDGVTFQPINDETRIALAGIAMGAWAVFWISKTIRACARTCANVVAEKGDSAESEA